MKRKIITVLCLMGLISVALPGCSDTGQDQNTLSDMENDQPLENATGMSSVISIEDAYYYDILEDSEGNLLAVTDNDIIGENTGQPVIAWESSDKGETWKELICQPETVPQDSMFLSGVIREGKDGAEVFAVFEDHAEDVEEGGGSHLLRITEAGYEELKTGEEFQETGLIWDITFVNDHVLALGGSEQCAFYDIEKQEVLKSLSVDPMAVGFLPMEGQFVVYGTELVSCLDAETLEEEEPEEGLELFVADMFEKNNSEVISPMCSYGDAVISATADGIYEYRDGKTVRSLTIPDTANGGKAFNVMFPMCKGKDNTYYVAGMPVRGTELLRIEEDKDAEGGDGTFSIYSLDENPDVSQMAMLFQQEHPELDVEVRVGLEDEAALTRTDAIRQLNTELLAGEGPDIIFMDGLPVNKYTDMELLLPLELERAEEKYLDNIIETYQKNDTLYAVPSGFWLYGLQEKPGSGSDPASPQEVGQWMLANAGESGMDGYLYTEGYNTYSQYVQFLYEVYAGQMVAGEEADRNTLEEYFGFCKELSDATGQHILGEEYIAYSNFDGSIEIHANEKVNASAGLILDAGDMATMMTQSRENEAAYVLYPMYRPRNIIAINASTEQEETAQEFVASALEDSSQKLHSNTTFPVTTESFRAALGGEGKDPLPDGTMIQVLLDEEVFSIYCPMADEVSSLEQEIQDMDLVYNDDAILRDMVMEALDSYLSGNTTFDDAVSSAENKINLYLGE